MGVKFVTAIYTGLMGTRFNGAPDAIYNRYKRSLESIAKGGYEIVCYTDAKHYDELVEFYKEYPNLEVVSEELTDFYHHAEIEKIKDEQPRYMTDISWYTRCVEVMWGKFYWMYRHAALADTNDAIFWIDSGLFHSGTMHPKWKTPDIPEGDKSFDFNRITQERDLYADLNRHADGKLLNVRCSFPNHGADDYLKVFGSEDGRPQYGIIGGIFGGSRDLLLDYCSDIMDTMQQTIDAKELLKEEELMYRVHSQNPDRFVAFEFRTWYHEDWSPDYRRGETISFSDYFEFLRN